MAGIIVVFSVVEFIHMHHMGGKVRKAHRKLLDAQDDHQRTIKGLKSSHRSQLQASFNPDQLAAYWEAHKEALTSNSSKEQGKRIREAMEMFEEKDPAAASLLLKAYERGQENVRLRMRKKR